MLNNFDYLILQGCQACNCDLIGSVNNTCDQPTGQCQCRQGVIGLRCDNCLPYQYGFSLEGCRPCDCDQIGSISLQCDPLGQCPVNKMNKNHNEYAIIFIISLNYFIF